MPQLDFRLRSRPLESQNLSEQKGHFDINQLHAVILAPIYQFCDFAEKFQVPILVKHSLLEAINYAEVRLGKNPNKFILYNEIEYSQL